ncbi:hypothetical protein GGX14DRAFT_388527 [Mycena pura]|uniref:Uncharacterized protein n=1 Tax=Mycena pura TaxID=153505 RepID=A0AAD6VSA6_9AGAR|nr:hypothetical protein GGX14DRAFT_388527 [Mycena pura]
MLPASSKQGVAQTWRRESLGSYSYNSRSMEHFSRLTCCTAVTLRLRAHTPRYNDALSPERNPYRTLYAGRIPRVTLLIGGDAGSASSPENGRTVRDGRHVHVIPRSAEEKRFGGVMQALEHAHSSLLPSAAAPKQFEMPVVHMWSDRGNRRYGYVIVHASNSTAYKMGSRQEAAAAF